MSRCGNDRLRNKDLLTARAFLTLGQTRLGASRIYRFQNDDVPIAMIMVERRDGARFILIAIFTIAALLTRLAFGRLFCFVPFTEAMSHRVHVMIRICVITINAGIGDIAFLRASRLRCLGFIVMSGCGSKLFFAHRADLCLRASCRLTGFMSQRRFHFHVTHGAILCCRTSRRLSGLMSRGCQFHTANRTGLCRGTSRCRARRMTKRRFQFYAANSTMLRVRTVGSRARLMRGKNDLLLHKHLFTERTVRAFGQSVFRASCGNGRIGHGNVITGGNRLRDHINAEMVGHKGNFSFIDLRGDLSRGIAAHIIYNGIFLGDLCRKRESNRHVAARIVYTSAAPKLHIIETVGFLIDGKRLRHGFQFFVVQNLIHTEFRILRERTAVADDRRVLSGIVYARHRGIAKEAPSQNAAKHSKKQKDRNDKGCFALFLLLVFFRHGLAVEDPFDRIVEIAVKALVRRVQALHRGQRGRQFARRKSIVGNEQRIGLFLTLLNSLFISCPLVFQPRRGNILGF